MELRDTARDKARIRGLWHMAIFAVCVLVLAAAVFVVLLTIGGSEVGEVNAPAGRPPATSR
jgi:hypothetical protein